MEYTINDCIELASVKKRLFFLNKTSEITFFNDVPGPLLFLTHVLLLCSVYFFLHKRKSLVIRLEIQEQDREVIELQEEGDTGGAYRITFGKYKGRCIRAIPPKYIDWLEKNNVLKAFRISHTTYDVASKSETNRASRGF